MGKPDKGIRSICHFYLGTGIAVKLFVDGSMGCSGKVGTPYEERKTAWQMTIGIGENWANTLACFIHECEEMFMIAHEKGYDQSYRWIQGSPNRMFFIGHQDLDEMNYCLADALIYVMPLLKKAWKKHHKKPRKKAKKKK